MNNKKKLLYGWIIRYFKTQQMENKIKAIPKGKKLICTTSCYKSSEATLFMSVKNTLKSQYQSTKNIECQTVQLTTKQVFKEIYFNLPVQKENLSTSDREFSSCVGYRESWPKKLIEILMMVILKSPKESLYTFCACVTPANGKPPVTRHLSLMDDITFPCCMVIGRGIAAINLEVTYSYIYFLFLTLQHVQT